MTFRKTTLLFAAAFAVSCIAGCGLPEGSEGGPCFSNDTCDEGLECRSDLCVSGEESPETLSPGVSPNTSSPETPSPDAPLPAACGPSDVYSHCDNQRDISVCENGQTGVFNCDAFCTSEGSNGGQCIILSDADADCECNAAANSHGDLCDATVSGGCGFPSSGLTCVVERQGDTQGVCRLVCSSWSDCANNDDAFDLFDTDCCDINNGSRVCADDNVYPEACSQ